MNDSQFSQVAATVRQHNTTILFYNNLVLQRFGFANNRPKGAGSTYTQRGRKIGDVARMPEFTVSQLEQACPGVSRDMIRRVLRSQQDAKAIECQGRGPAARWMKKG